MGGWLGWFHSCFLSLLLGPTCFFFPHFSPSFISSEGHDDHDHDHDHDDEGAAADSGSNHVIVLTDENFASTVASHDSILVEFYAPWCGHCQKLEPEWNEASNILAGKAAIGKMDCTVHKETCGTFDVKGFPTIKLIKKSQSEPVEYKGERTAEAIVKFMTKQSGPAVAAIADAAALKALEEASDISVVGFFAADSEEGKAFAAAADSLREDYSFHSSSDAALASSVGVSVPAVVVFKPFDEKRAIFSGSITSDALSAFVKKQALPLFGEIGPENYQKYLDRELPLTWVFLDYEADNAAVSLFFVVPRRGECLVCLFLFLSFSTSALCASRQNLKLCV
jgi:protein disulfide-isomerase A1